jgi:hypothetical protein
MVQQPIKSLLRLIQAIHLDEQISEHYHNHILTDYSAYYFESASALCFASKSLKITTE